MRFQIPSLLVGMLFVAGMSAIAVADASHDRTQFGRNIEVQAGEEVSEVTCFGCSVRIRGDVKSDVTTFGGGIVVEDQGRIEGDATSFGGAVRLEKGSEVGAVSVFGGRLHRDPEASVHGDVTTFTGSFWLLLIFLVPIAFLAGIVVLIVWLVRVLTRPRATAPA
jgi:hypothetical protein